MFNDLNSQTNPGHQAVDDIFAETDKPAANGIQSDIETHNVGLASTGENMPGIENEQATEKRNYLKIIIIVTLSLAVLGGAYLAYSQFFKNNGNAGVAPIVDNQPATTTNTTTPSKPVENNFVAIIPGVATTTVSPIETATSSELATSSSLEDIGIPAVSTIDSDKDGLTDVEEAAAGTNPNVIDTDNDGLSDYEEVIVYKTDPLNADTDGDTYLDGEEIKNGYNPCGINEKLPATSSLEELCAKYKK